MLGAGYLLGLGGLEKTAAVGALLGNSMKALGGAAKGLGTQAWNSARAAAPGVWSCVKSFVPDAWKQMGKGYQMMGRAVQSPVKSAKGLASQQKVFNKGLKDFAVGAGTLGATGAAGAYGAYKLLGGGNVQANQKYR